MRKKKNKRKNYERHNKMIFSHLILSTVRRINETLGVDFIVKFLRVFIYKCFESLCYVYLGAAPTLGASLKPPNPYLTNTTGLLDNEVK